MRYLAYPAPACCLSSVLLLLLAACDEMTIPRAGGDAGSPPMTADSGSPPPTDSGAGTRDSGSPRVDSGPPSSCRADEMKYGNSCYAVLSMPNSFDDARVSCTARGAEAVTIESKAENDAVYGFLPASVSAVWIGLVRADANSFDWISGESFSYRNWAENEPNNDTGDEDCVVMWGPNLSFAELRGAWNDAPCTEPPRSAIVCERAAE